VIESGLMNIKSLPMVMQMSFMLPGGAALLENLPDPLGTRGAILTRLSRCFTAINAILTLVKAISMPLYRCFNFISMPP